MISKNAFHAPLNMKDTDKQTYGCRHTQPEICGKNCMPKICAFENADNICYSPPKSWPKQFRKLKENK